VIDRRRIKIDEGDGSLHTGEREGGGELGQLKEKVAGIKRRIKEKMPILSYSLLSSPAKVYSKCKIIRS